jgi:TolB-like protein/DNA-binding winged helix-turn-helix (wHTH) protein/Tfp pilus assembly protein PilF
METRDKPSYQFGAFQLNPAGRELLRGNERLELPPRVFDTLVLLVEEKGKLVEKDRLMGAVWPDTVVEENNLSQAIYLLRKTLNDGDNGVRYIETVSKRGYRFVARVQQVENEAESSRGEGSLPDQSGPVHGNSGNNSGNHDSSQSLIQAPPKSRRLIWWIAGLVGVVGVLLVVQAGGWWDRQKNQSEADPIRSVAVLPLQNLSNDPEQEYFADGMTDELITELAQVRQLKVVSKTSVMQYKGVHRPLTQIGRELGVDAVVEGSILRSGDRVRITAQLIRTATDHHIWAKAYEGDLKNVLSLQALVAEAITDEVKLGLTPAERNRFRASRPVDPDAYEAYLRGRYFWNRRDVSGFQKAIEYFNQAIKKDPNFALAYAGLADCDTLLALETLGPGLMAQAKASALKAIELDDGLAEAHTSLAAVRIFLDWDWTGSELEFKRALELNTNYAPAHHWYGNILLGPLGRHEEAIAELKRARELDPLSLIINTDLGYAYYLSRQYDSAFAQYQKVLEMDHNFVPVHHDLLRYYAQKKMYDAWLQEEVADSDGSPQRAQTFKRLYASGGFPAVMLKMAESRGEPETGAKVTQKGSFCTAAESYGALNAKPKALAALEQCYLEREPGLIYLKVDPAWDTLRSEPAFQNLEHRIGLQ